MSKKKNKIQKKLYMERCDVIALSKTPCVHVFDYILRSFQFCFGLNVRRKNNTHMHTLFTIAIPYSGY